MIGGDLSCVHRSDCVDDAVAEAGEHPRHVEKSDRVGNDDQHPADDKGHRPEEQCRLPAEPVGEVGGGYRR